MTSTDRALEAQLTAALGGSMSPAAAAVVDARVAEAMTRPVGRSRRRVTPRRVAVLVLVALAVPTLVAASGLFGTEDPFGLTDAAGFQAELDSAMAITPLPAGAVWPDFLTSDPSVAYSAGGGRAWVEMVSMCLWETEWLHARAAGDAAREAVARTTILGFPDWYSTSSVFFQPAGARAAYLAPIVAGVRVGDPTALSRDVALNCSGMAPFVAP